MGLKLGDASLKGFPQSGPPKFWSFKPQQLRWIKFSEWVEIKNKLHLTKIGGTTIRFTPSNGPSKIQTFTF